MQIVCCVLEGEEEEVGNLTNVPYNLSMLVNDTEIQQHEIKLASILLPLPCIRIRYHMCMFINQTVTIFFSDISIGVIGVP